MEFTAIDLFVTCPPAVENLLGNELHAVGAQSVKLTASGASCTGGLDTAYRVCLYSRIASRVLLPVARATVSKGDDMYAAARSVRWHEHLSVGATFAVSATVSGPVVTHSRYAALRVKDAVADHFRDRTGARPSVRQVRPDVQLDVHVHGEDLVISVDLSGESLHRRGYRRSAGEAPLKENVAAAVLLRAGWPGILAGGGCFFDPLCGSGTLVIEAALMAADAAPGALRRYFGFQRWGGHDDALWKRLLAEADERRKRKLPVLCAGSDRDGAAIHQARRHSGNAGLSEVVHFFVADVSQTQAPVGCRSGGLVATNPPYGERIGQREDLDALYRTIGNTLERRFAGWRAAVLTADPELSFSTGMRAVKTNTIYNGALKCVLAQFEPGREKRLSPRRDESPGGSEGARMFANRLRKNARSRRRWASRNDLTCYRVYDADMPEYAAAIDFYEGMWVHLQEYAPPPEIEPETAQRRLEEMIAVVPEVLDVDPADVYVKQRKRQRGSAQYEKIAERGEFRQVHEGGNTFLINLTDYLDTGIFLDHRPTRRLLRTLAKGQDFLNLFCYTATATVYAAQGGARSTVSVDSSRTYLEWAEKNLGLNGYPSDRHRLVRDDCMAFLAKHTRRYGLIFVDPPTFSNTKSSRQDFVLQRDHGELIRHTAALLTQGGILIFSTNFQRFSLDESAMTGLQVTEITAATVPEDFRRTPHVHRAWRITREE